MLKKITISGVIIALLALVLSFYQEINNKDKKQTNKIIMENQSLIIKKQTGQITTGNKSPIINTKDGNVELNY